MQDTGAQPVLSRLPEKSMLCIRARLLVVPLTAKEKLGFRACVRTKQRKPQISPLRFAPVEMTNLLSN
jgi:hypothetical protein